MVTATTKAKVEIDEDALPFLDDAGMAAVDAIAEWILSHVVDFDLKLVGPIRLRHWQSIEDPRSHDLIVDFTAKGSSERALELQDATAEVLAECLRNHPSAASDLLCTEVHWR